MLDRVDEVERLDLFGHRLDGRRQGRAEDGRRRRLPLSFRTAISTAVASVVADPADFGPPRTCSLSKIGGQLHTDQAEASGRSRLMPPSTAPL